MWFFMISLSIFPEFVELSTIEDLLFTRGMNDDMAVELKSSADFFGEVAP